MMSNSPILSSVLNKICDKAEITSIDEQRRRRSVAEKHNITITVVGGKEEKTALHPRFIGYNDYKGKYIFLYQFDLPEIMYDDIASALIMLKEKGIIVEGNPITESDGQKFFEVDLPDGFTRVGTKEEKQKKSLFEIKESKVYYAGHNPVALAAMELPVLKFLIKNFNRWVTYSKIQNIIKGINSKAMTKEAMNAVDRLNKKLKSGFELKHKPIENRSENKKTKKEGAYILLN